MRVIGVLLFLVIMAGGLVWSLLPAGETRGAAGGAAAQSVAPNKERGSSRSAWMDRAHSLVDRLSHVPLPRVQRPGRRVRFEESLDLTALDDAGPSAPSAAPGSFTYVTDPSPERIPIHIRLFGALRLVFLIALSAAAVAFALWAAGYLLNQQFLKLVGPEN